MAAVLDPLGVATDARGRSPGDVLTGLPGKVRRQSATPRMPPSLSPWPPLTGALVMRWPLLDRVSRQPALDMRCGLWKMPTAWQAWGKTRMIVRDMGARAPAISCFVGRRCQGGASRTTVWRVCGVAGTGASAPSPRSGPLPLPRLLWLLAPCC